MNGLVHALALSGTTLYAGGEFTSAGGVAANHIAKWDGNTWSALGAGMDDIVWALAVSGTHALRWGRIHQGGRRRGQLHCQMERQCLVGLGLGDGWLYPWVHALAVSGSTLYVGGDFTTAGGVTANCVAKWNGSVWSALGSGMAAVNPLLLSVRALAVSGTDLYAGGLFDTAGGVAANNIAKWNGSAWSALGSGMNSYVYALASSGATLYAGGAFTMVGGVTANYIAAWNGSAWSALGPGLGVAEDWPEVHALAISGTTLYAGGEFTTAGGVPAEYIAAWNGSEWSALGSGMDLFVQALTPDGSGHLFVGGAFFLAGTNVSPFIAEFVTGTPPVGDNLPPSLAITSHTDLETVAVNAITLTGSASDAARGDNGVKSVTVNGTLAAGGTATSNNVANWSGVVSLVAGTNTVKVVASDNASPPNSVTNVIRIISDTVRPTLTITSPTANQRWSNVWFTVKGTAKDNLQVTSVWCQVNGANSYLAQTTNGWTNWTTSVPLTPRTNLISAYAVDSAGNSSTTNSVNLVYVVTNLLQVAATGKGTLSPNYSNAWLEIGLPYSMTATPASGFVFTNWTISTNWLGGVTTNAATVKFMMASNLTLQVNFVDVTKPTLAISSPASGQRMTNALATIRGTAGDNWGISGVWYQLNSGDWSRSATTNSWTNWTTTVQLIAGTNIVKAYAADLGGNYSATNSLNVVSSNTFRLQLGFGTCPAAGQQRLELHR